MKNYSLTFDNDRFDIDITPRDENSVVYELLENEESLYILAPFPDQQEDLLKVYYPIDSYRLLSKALQTSMFWQFIFLSFIAVIISILFSTYILKPLRESIKLLEIFIKDIIHDLNTPITSILINLKMMDAKNDEVESITKSAKTIAMLHYNLDTYLKELQYKSEKFDIKEVIEEQVSFFAPMYDYLKWETHIENMIIKSDKNALSRVVYNLLSNASKYNTAQGKIYISLQENILAISNTSYGIKNPTRIFERFYKESDRGLGIGLHIVDKLCKELDISIEVKVEDTLITFLLDLSKVTTK
ncbi:MAG: HAMP domain-containing histidine kinase [Sulfurovum sp.]|nr:HAMP domain-containing histidine kinase [Sulfurovum sp.]